MNFTIITPIFDRANFIEKLYKNISNQKGIIQWILVDDGSKDKIKDKIKKVQQVYRSRKNTNFEFQYLKKENGGKHTAVNLGIQFANHEWIIILDSDDVLTNSCLEVINDKINSLTKEKMDAISGLIFLKKDTKNEIIGQKFPKENDLMYHRDLAKIKGDKFRVTKTFLLKKNLFPIYEDENFVTESTVWNLIESKNPLVCFNKVLSIVEYLDDGLTNNYDKLIEESPKGTFHYVSVTLKLTSYNIFKDIGLYRSLFGHYFHIRSFKRNKTIVKDFKFKGIYFLFWFYIYRIIAYIFYGDFRK